MSKELTPLEALNNIKLKLVRSYDNSCGCNGNVMFEKELPIIENALKDLSWYKEQLKDFDIKENQLRETFIVYKNYQVDEKELKALEIIKENDVDCSVLKDCIVRYKEMALKHYNEVAWIYEHNQLTQEEYDLLKEVLL